MKPFTLRPLFALVVLAALAPGRANGDMVNFAYTWTLGDTYLSAFGQGPINLSSSVSPDGSTFTVDHGAGTASLTLASPGTSAAMSGESPVTIPVGTLAATSSGTPTGNFSYSAGMNLTLRLTAGGESGDLALSASIYGNVSPKGTDASASGWTTFGAQSIFLGGHWFSAGFGVDGTTSPVPGGDPVPFDIQIYIDGKDIFPIDPIPVDGSKGGPASTPEPSALLLGATAAALCGLRIMRRRPAAGRSRRPR